MALLDVAQIETQGADLLVVFVPPETNFFNDSQRARLRDVLIRALVAHGLSGELVAAWQHEGEFSFMAHPRLHNFLASAGYEAIYAHRSAQIECA